MTGSCAGLSEILNLTKANQKSRENEASFCGE
jgi:hypothetical protein